MSEKLEDLRRIECPVCKTMNPIILFNGIYVAICSECNKILYKFKEEPREQKRKQKKIV